MCVCVFYSFSRGTLRLELPNSLAISQPSSGCVVLSALPVEFNRRRSVIADYEQQINDAERRRDLASTSQQSLKHDLTSMV